MPGHYTKLLRGPLIRLRTSSTLFSVISIVTARSLAIWHLFGGSRTKLWWGRHHGFANGQNSVDLQQAVLYRVIQRPLVEMADLAPVLNRLDPATTTKSASEASNLLNLGNPWAGTLHIIGNYMDWIIRKSWDSVRINIVLLRYL